MRKTKILIVLLLALLPFIGWAQHVSIKQINGDSIQYDLDGILAHEFRPVVKEGKVVWSFNGQYNTYDKKGSSVIVGEVFSLDNVESIDFRSKDYEEQEVRKALVEFYKAMDGDHWTRNDNWCSDKPISEWYGIITNGKPYVYQLVLPDNNLSGKIPESIMRIGPVSDIILWGNNIEGAIPEYLANNYSISAFSISGNKFSGNFPNHLLELPYLWTLSISGNQFDGSLPSGKDIERVMNRVHGTCLDFAKNNFSGKVPDVIKNNPLFADAWPNIIMNNPGLDLSDITIPAPVFIANDIDGNSVDLEEVYKKNKYTLLYKWGWWCPFSADFNRQLMPVYKAYKEKNIEFEVIGIHDGDNEQLPDYLKEHPVPWPHNIVYDSWEPVSRGLFINCGFPTLFLVDQDGKVIFTSLADENYQDPKDDRKWKLFPYLEKHLGPIDYNFYTSTDYSHDGGVTTLQTATAGQGIDLVFLGEGFTDKDIDNGTFDSKMTAALNQFFAYEPYTSLRDCFNVYAVKAVSPNAEFFGSNSVHAIDEDVSKALEYASKVQDLIPNRPMHVVVVYNNPSGGRSYCMMMEDDSFVCFAMDGVSNVLNHEAGGHGFGKLFDEYEEYTGMTLPEEQKTELENQWTTKGWGANVDWRSDPAEVKWAKFINDARYADERIGTYEGSYLYQLGAYRPTENSMMRYNDSPFNAPSREEIYKRVMKESEGDGWTYDYETFVAFDAAGHQQFVDALNTNRARKMKDTKVDRKLLTAPPVFLKGTWRDALNKNKK